MKKLLTLLLSLAMIATVSLTAFAVEIGPNDLDENGKATFQSTVTYSASDNNTGNEDDGDIAMDEEAWTVTVPTTMTAGTSHATVTVSGAFAESKTLTVTAPPSVKLYLNGIETNDYMVLNVDFNNISLQGNYKETSITETAEISIQDMSEIKFGVWKGTLTFMIELSDTEGWVASDILNKN